jgi:ATP-binding cassette, subfamily B, multidrug efflux pump
VKSLRTLLPYLRPHRRRLALGLLFVVASSALGSALPWLLRSAVDGLHVGLSPRRTYLLAGAIVGLAVVTGALRYAMREFMNGVSRRIEYDLRNALFQHLETLDAAYFAQTRTGDLMARLTNDLGAVRMAAGPAIMYLVNTIAGGLFALVFMLRISPQLTAVALLPMVFLPFVMARLGTAIHSRFEAVQEHFSTLTTRAQENLSGVRIVRAYRQEEAEMARFGALNEEYLGRNMQLVRLYGAMNPAFALLAGLGGVAVLGLGGTLALRGVITVGSFVAFGLYLGILTWPLIALGWVINLFQRGAASMARLNEILDARPAVTDPTSPRRLPPAAGGRTLEFRHVGFHYPTAAGADPRWALRDVSFTIPAGGTLGVVGATGSGKSTLIDLIPRIADPQEGEILLDGVPIRDLPLRELRAEIGYVPQESLLFSDTISANIRYGLPETEAAIAAARLDGGDSREQADDAAMNDSPQPDRASGDADARWAARVAQLDATIAAFPHGYATMLGERGINLSGGQKQRAALARALARRPRLVLLDDALSAVDTHTEAEILHSLRDAIASRTAVIASHRISAIRDATWIIVLDGGRVVEQGHHADLLALGGRYWSLLRRQQLEDAIEGEGEADDADEALAADAPDGKIPT